jgi:16S rRNA (cytosine1402-N4)-methyltransferase
LTILLDSARGLNDASARLDVSTGLSDASARLDAATGPDFPTSFDAPIRELRPDCGRSRKGGRSGKRAGATRSELRAASAAEGRGGAGADAGGESHVPVLAAELLELLDPHAGQVAIDCTFGGGGHARMLAQRLGSTGTLIAIDRDPLAEQRFVALAEEVSCTLRFIRGGYAEALELLAREGLRADLVYFDLGMSSMQVDTRERGFSYSYEAPLDMRMDPDQEGSAREIVATWDQRKLARMLRDYGEERHAGAIARAIVRRREQAPIETTLELVDVINSAIPTPARFAGGHPAKRVFQALRIAVNDELEQLDRALPLAWGILREGGVLAGISFHSLEDRRVKRFLVERARGCICPPDLPVCACGREPEAALLSRRSLVPSAAEIARNPRAASARLRAARKLLDEQLDIGGEA